MNQNDLDIISGLRSGTESAYYQLFSRYYLLLTIFAKKYVFDIETAKDIVQSVFVLIFEKRKSIIINTSLNSYLFQTVKNACLNHIRHVKINDKHIKELNKNAFDNELGYSDKMIEAELEIKISKSINKLPQKCRQIFNMSRFEGKKNAEIADELRISKRTVETQISKALKFLRSELRVILLIIIFFIVS